MNTKVLRETSIQELQNELNSLYRELFSLRMQRGMQEMTKPHLFTKARRSIARIKTVINEKKAEGK